MPLNQITNYTLPDGQFEIVTNLPQTQAPTVRFSGNFPTGWYEYQLSQGTNTSPGTGSTGTITIGTSNTAYNYPQYNFNASNTSSITISRTATWTSGNTAFGTTANGLACLIYGTNLWVAGGYSNSLGTSPDGQNWTQRTSTFAAGAQVRTVAYSPTATNRYLIGGTSSTNVIKLATSTDGATWTARTITGAGTRIDAAIWNGTYYIIHDGGGRIQTSPDGVTWTSRRASGSQSPGSNANIATNGSGLVVGTFNSTPAAIYRSTDGVTWADSTISGFPSASATCIGYGNGYFFVGGEFSYVSRSTDGVTWTTPIQTDASSLQSYGAAYAVNSGRYIFSRQNGSGLIASTDFVSWTATTNAPYGYIAEVRVGPGNNIMLGSTNSQMYFSTSGYGDAAGNNVAKIKYLGPTGSMASGTPA